MFDAFDQAHGLHAFAPAPPTRLLVVPATAHGGVAHQLLWLLARRLARQGEQVLVLDGMATESAGSGLRALLEATPGAPVPWPGDWTEDAVSGVHIMPGRLGLLQLGTQLMDELLVMLQPLGLFEQMPVLCVTLGDAVGQPQSGLTVIQDNGFQLVLHLVQLQQQQLVFLAEVGQLAVGASTCSQSGLERFGLGLVCLVELHQLRSHVLHGRMLGLRRFVRGGQHIRLPVHLALGGQHPLAQGLQGLIG